MKPSGICVKLWRILLSFIIEFSFVRLIYGPAHSGIHPIFFILQENLFLKTGKIQRLPTQVHRESLWN
jgi:hypothetical protein